MQELGTLADWVVAGGGLLAVFAAVMAWRSSERLLSIEKGRDKKIVIAAERHQAEHIFAVGALVTKSGDDDRWAIYIHNGSSQPIFDVVIESQKANGSVSNRNLELSAVPPGRFIVQTSNQYGWGALIDVSGMEERLQFVVKGSGGKMISCVIFTDCERRTWRLNDGGVLTRLEP